MISAFAGLSWFAVVAEEAARYLLFVGLFLLITRIRPSRWVARRGVQRRAAGRGDFRREALAGLSSLLIFCTVIYLTARGADAGIFRVYRDIEAYGWLYFTASIVLIILAHDAYFYWTHRLMHLRALQRFHLIHHRSHAPTPWTGYSFHPVEAVVVAGFIPLYLLVVPTHPVVLAIFMTFQVIANVFGHCGYEMMPTRVKTRRRLWFMGTVTFHDLHHSSPRGNFGLYLTVWDRVMATTHPGYHAEEERVAALVNRP